MTKGEFEQAYWDQYIELNDELSIIGKYVTIESSNFGTYSLKLQKLLLEVGSELDNVMKEVSGLSQKDRTNIADYCPIILSTFPNIVKQKVLINDIRITPFDGWDASRPSKSLPFWEAYNSVKHDRVKNKAFASLENVVYALGGLFILEMYEMDALYKNSTSLLSNFPHDNEKTGLFILVDWDYHIHSDNIKSKYGLIDDKTGERLL